MGVHGASVACAKAPRQERPQHIRGKKSRWWLKDEAGEGAPGERGSRGRGGGGEGPGRRSHASSDLIGRGGSGPWPKAMQNAEEVYTAERHGRVLTTWGACKPGWIPQTHHTAQGYRLLCKGGITKDHLPGPLLFDGVST